MLSADADAAGAGAGAELRSLAPVAGPEHDSRSAARQHHPGLLLGRTPAHLGCALAATMRLWAGAVPCRPPTLPDEGLTVPLARQLWEGRDSEVSAVSDTPVDVIRRLMSRARLPG